MRNWRFFLRTVNVADGSERRACDGVGLGESGYPATDSGSMHDGPSVNDRCLFGTDGATAIMTDGTVNDAHSFQCVVNALAVPLLLRTMVTLLVSLLLRSFCLGLEQW